MGTVLPITAPGLAGQQPERKRLATLQAVAALRGVRVDPLESDAGRTVYIVSLQSLTRQCDTLDEVHALLKRMGVAVE